LIESLDEICFNHFDKNHELESATIKIKAKLKMLQELRAEKLSFINGFPAAIARIIDISGLKKRAMTIQKANCVKIDQIAEKLSQTRQKCVNPTCIGFALSSLTDKHIECNVCGIKMCGKCCKGILIDAPHVCLPEDIQSVEHIASLVKCPKCLTPAVKGDGCNFVTCAICQQHYHSETGEPTDNGNHDNRVVTIKPVNLENLTADEKINDVLYEIKLAKPILKRPSVLVKTRSWAKTYEKYFRAKSQSVLYARVCHQIWSEYEAGSLTLETLTALKLRLKI